MAIAADWTALNKAEQKAQLESAIAAILDRLEKQSAPATDWQKAKVIDAIDATTRGLFEVASTHLSHVFAEADAGRPLPHPDTNLADPATVTLSMLRAALDQLKARPVQDPPDYL